MAEEKIQKISVARASLPPMNADTESYLYRYRVISEDRNQVSHWTPVQSVSIPPVAQLSEDQYSARKSESNNSNDVILVWTTPESLVGVSLDVYARWSGNDQYRHETSVSGLDAYPWQYVASTSGSSYSIIIPATITNYVTGVTSVSPKHLILAVQVPTYPKKIVPNATLLKSAELNI
jgi:hypothetical protein